MTKREVGRVADRKSEFHRFDLAQGILCLAKNMRDKDRGLRASSFFDFHETSFSVSQASQDRNISMVVALICGRTMNVIRKTIFFLGIAAPLLCVPLTAAAEDEDIRTSPTVNSAIAPAAASLRAPSTACTRGRVSETIVTAPTPATLRYVSEQVANFVLRDGRSYLRSFCLLRC